MNKYDMTLRQIHHDRPLRKYYSPHETKEMTDCIRLYNDKILDDYQPKDIMKMVKQNVCNDEMVPLALEILRSNIMVKVEHYSGDLLSAVVRVDKSYWKCHEGERLEVAVLLEKMKERIDTFVEIFNV